MSYMIKPTEKAPAIADFLEGLAGRTTAIESAKCVSAPFGCGQGIGDPEKHFTSDLSFKEYRISGLCQSCQGKIFS